MASKLSLNQRKNINIVRNIFVEEDTFPNLAAIIQQIATFVWNFFLLNSNVFFETYIEGIGI